MVGDSSAKRNVGDFLVHAGAKGVLLIELLFSCCRNDVVFISTPSSLLVDPPKVSAHKAFFAHALDRHVDAANVDLSPQLLFQTLFDEDTIDLLSSYSITEKDGCRKGEYISLVRVSRLSIADKIYPIWAMEFRRGFLLVCCESIINWYEKN